MNAAPPPMRESESAGRVRRDGLKVGGEASGARRGEPRCLDIPPEFVPDRAYYNTTGDFVQVPPPAAYFEPINWHRTAFHELGHWTGHASRLNRDHSGSFGSKSYAREELVAEMAGAFVCASLGIVPTVRHADYIGSWLEVLREDNRAVVRAASAASKAADFLLGFLTQAIDSVAASNEEAA